MNKNKINKIKILSTGQSANAHQGESLINVIRSLNIPLNVYCGSKGLCGKCGVEIVRGDLPPMKEKEIMLAENKKLASHSRLACLYKVNGDITIRIPKSSISAEIHDYDTKALILTNPLFVEPGIKKYSLNLPLPDSVNPASLGEAIKKHTSKNLRLSLNAADSLSRVLTRQHGRPRITIVVLDEREILDVESGDTSSQAYGVAVDIGTSTLVVELIDLVSGRILDTAAAVNDQVKYGLDVVSRIAFAFMNPENLMLMSTVVRNQIDGMIQALVHKTKISSRHIYEIVVAGNTVMNHIFLGVPVSTLAMSPFCGVFGQAPEARAVELGLLKTNPQARIYTSPNIKSFVGGDIAAGLSGLEFEKKQGRLLFIDLGTNGEIVLKNGPRTTATSTAAGPAFEGMAISCGMPALPHAIYAARWAVNGFSVQTIQGRSPYGICGSGLIDILALSLNKGFISREGRITTRSKTIRVAGRISLTQDDIRRMQLAIAAIKSGVGMILKSQDLTAAGLDKIFVGGAFGSSLNIRNAIAVGLLPDISRDKIVFIGNSSLAGARKLLLSRPERRKIESFAASIRHLSLAGDKTFETQFIKALELGPYSQERP